jgi:hypothetical protein
MGAKSPKLASPPPYLTKSPEPVPQNPVNSTEFLPYVPPKSPEPVPPNPVNSTEFLPYVPPNLYTRSHFSPPNPTPLFCNLQLWIYFCAIIYTQKLIFKLAIFRGCAYVYYNPQNHFIASFRYLHINTGLLTYLSKSCTLSVRSATRHTTKTTMLIHNTTTPLLQQQQWRHHR